jgi:hypothetical protein
MLLGHIHTDTPSDSLASYLDCKRTLTVRRLLGLYEEYLGCTKWVQHDPRSVKKVLPYSWPNDYVLALICSMEQFMRLNYAKTLLHYDIGAPCLDSAHQKESRAEASRGQITVKACGHETIIQKDTYLNLRVNNIRVLLKLMVCRLSWTVYLEGEMVNLHW